MMQIGSNEMMQCSENTLLDIQQSTYIADCYHRQAELF